MIWMVAWFGVPVQGKVDCGAILESPRMYPGSLWDSQVVMIDLSVTQQYSEW